MTSMTVDKAMWVQRARTTCYFVLAVLVAASIGVLQAANPAHASTFTVTNTNDSGAGSLRQAILDANATGGADTIDFNIPTSDPNRNATTGVFTISPSSPLPTITDPVTIEGYTQGDGTPADPADDATPNTQEVGNDARLLIELNGGTTFSSGDGLRINTSNSTIKGLVINRFRLTGVFIEGGSGNRVEGNFIGTDPSGTQDLGNNVHGVLLFSASNNNTVGGTQAGARNIISGNNGDGVRSQAPDSKVEGNYIGTDASGTQPLGNSSAGVFFSSAPNNTVGGTQAGAGNIISGNNGDGVFIEGGSGNKVEGSFIGTDPSGTQDLGNSSAGVSLVSGNNNTVGGTQAGAGNIISGNNGDGVHIIFANSTGNRILSNSIYANTNLGIDLGDNGVTANDSGDADTGSNNLQNFPVLTSASRSDADGSTTIEGTLNSTPNTTFTLQFFSNPDADPSNHGEGKTYLGQKSDVTTDASGDATFSFTTSEEDVSVGHFVSATATNSTTNDTSEFSEVEQITVRPTSITVTNTNDSGAGSLRQAILDANATGGADTIDFNIPTSDPNRNATTGVFTISPSSPLPTITDPVTIEGYTQGDGTPADPTDDATPNTQEVGNDARLLIELNGTSAGGVSALTITASNSTIKGLVINRFGWQGVHISGSGATGNKVEGNYIGTNASGTQDLGNSSAGVFIEQASNNTVGGTQDGARNIISGNDFVGVYIQSFQGGATGNKVEGNYIGTNASGTQDLGNSFWGVYISGGGASDTTVGGTDADDGAEDGVVKARNIISGNDEYGVFIQSDTGFSGEPTGNRILSNSIHANGSLGIELAPAYPGDGVTANDSGDADTGSNNLQNFPVLNSAAVNADGSTTIEGTLNSTPSTTFTLQFFSNPDADPSNHGEGKTYLGQKSDVTTDASGDATFSFTTSEEDVSVGHFVSATATNSTTNDTSEFSEVEQVSGDTNDPPVNTVPGAQSTNEDGPLVFSGANGNQILISDPDAGTSPVQVRLQVDHATMTLDGAAGLTFSGGDSGTNDADMTFTGTITDINAALDGMSFDPEADYNGGATLTITTDDQGNTGAGGAKTDTDNVNITVDAVNDAPSFTKGADQSVDEDAGAQSVANWASGISAGPANESGQAVNFEVTNDNNALFSTQPSVSSNGTLTYTPEDNQSGTANVDVAAVDDGGMANGGDDTSVPQSFTITVNGVNDLPTISGIADQQINQNTDTGEIPFTIGDAETSAGSLTLSASSTNTTLVPDDEIVFGGSGADRTVKVTPVNDGVGTADITVTVTDANDGSSSETFKLRVRDATAPAAPTVDLVQTSDSGSSNTDNLTNDTTPTFEGTAEAGSTVELFAEGSSLGTANADGAGNWSFTVPDGQALADGTYSITAKATDAADNTSEPSDALSVSVDTTAPSAPSITTPANNSFDTDGNVTLSGTAEANSTVEIFEGTASRGTTTANSSGAWSKTLNGVTNGSHTYTAKATDAAGNTSGFSNARTVIVDTTAPKVKRVVPAEDATGIAPGANVNAFFSEAMRAASINTNTFKLFRAGTTTAIGATVTYDAATQRAILNPNANLALGVRYKAVVTTGARDLAGNQLDQDQNPSNGNQQKVWFFTVRT